MPSEKKSPFTTPKAKKAKLSAQSDGSTPGRSPASSVEIPPTPCLKRLGFGTGVNVMLFERSPRGGMTRSPWAIKKLRKRGEQSCIARRLEDEAAILKKMKHPNIIGYRGFRREKDGSLILMVENGQKALYDIIEEAREVTDETDEPPKPLDSEHILKVIHAVASALHYMHTEHKLLHGDLKSGNVLIIGDFEEIKLCDFGVTVPIDDNGVAKISSNVQYIGTEPWSAKEVIEGDEITAKTDIFALGCTIYEMLALETPHFNKMQNDIDFDDSNFDDSEYNDAIGTRPELPDYINHYLEDEEFEKIFALFYACTSENPDRRPSAKEILEILDLSER